MVTLNLPVGYYSIYPNISMNFQMNRWFGWVGEPEMLDEMRAITPRIHSYADWKREFLALAENASNRGHLLRSGFYYRSAEFFMRANDPDRKQARENFLAAVQQVYGLKEIEHHAIPYTDGKLTGSLPAYRFAPVRPKGTIVFFGGFDSYIEELTAAFFYFCDAGYEVIAFEGPGQGGALEADLPMTPEWDKPVRAVLDYFRLEAVTLIGLSLGGCLVIRAAAFEPRVERVIAYDIFTDFFEGNLRNMNPTLRGTLATLLKLRAGAMVNTLVARAEKKSPVIEWGVHQGMRVTGTSSPYDFLTMMRRFQTMDVSAQVKQDVLLLGGSQDHYVPVEQFHQQIKLLTNARSVTARLFTASESAQNHCQVGNYGLALRTIVNWLDGMQSVKR
jgi:alpha-beta hydrolase superfamily lysophospholipase